MDDREEAKVLNTCFISVSTLKIGFQPFSCAFWNREGQPALGDQQMKGLEKLVVVKSMGCMRFIQGWWNSILLWEGCLSSSESKWQLEELPASWKKSNTVLIFMRGRKHLGNNKLISLISVPGKVLGHVFLQSFSSYLKDRKEEPVWICQLQTLLDQHDCE